MTEDGEHSVDDCTLQGFIGSLSHLSRAESMRREERGMGCVTETAFHPHPELHLLMGILSLLLSQKETADQWMF